MKLFFRVILLSQFFGCVSAPKNTVSFDRDAFVTRDGDKRRLVKQGETVDISNGPILAESINGLPLLILPTDTGESVGISFHEIPRADDLKKEEEEEAVNRILSEILPTISEINIKLASERYQEALTLIEQLKLSHQNLSFLHFVHASCLLLSGERERARAMLELGLKDFPESKDGQTLKNFLDGSSSSVDMDSKPLIDNVSEPKIPNSLSGED